MLRSSLTLLRCPACGGKLALHASGSEPEVASGELLCSPCQLRFPILAGVAVLVEDVRGYLLTHVKGISRLVRDEEIPKTLRREFREAREELREMGDEHIEEDLEAERVVSLYLMNHYLTTRGETWWKPRAGSQSELFDRLIREYWDRGPLTRIAELVRALGSKDSVIEVGCGVGGLSRMLAGASRSYLGVDSSFASIALARHIALGAPYSGEIRIPGDLLDGPVSLKAPIARQAPRVEHCDFVVGDIEALPVAREAFDVSIALNAIDMLHEPSSLPELQRDLLVPGGVALQSCPYIWHAQIARALREQLPSSVRDSASAVEWLYTEAGLTIEKREDQVPWLFYKHLRQLEIYSVHLFQARKS